MIKLKINFMASSGENAGSTDYKLYANSKSKEIRYDSLRCFFFIKSNRQKQKFCHPKMADLKAWSHGVRKANYITKFGILRANLLS